MTRKEREQLSKSRKSLKELLEALHRGEIFKEDLPQDILDELKKKLFQ